MGRVCVVGSFMMDLVARAPRRPALGETIVGSEFGMFLGGKGFNQAVAAARSGATTAMIGQLGNDDFGRRFLAALDREGIDRAAVACEGSTGVGLPLVEDSGDNSIVIVPQANAALDAAAVQKAATTIASSDVLLLQLELPVDASVEAARLAHAEGVTVVLNPAPASSELARFAGLVDYVVPNETELSGEIDALGALAVIVTLGPRGAEIRGATTPITVSPHGVTCIDSVGAGDAFCGAMAARLATGAPLEDAVRYGNAAGALAVTVRGAEPSMPTLAGIEALLRV